MKKVLILYYSFEGNTEKIASYLSEKMEADLEKVRPIKDLKAKGFLKYVIGGFLAISKNKPKLNPLKFNPNDYDLIIIGSPIWASRISPAIFSLLKRDIIKDKKVGFFYTYLGGNKETDNLIIDCVEQKNKLLSIHPCLLSVNENYENQKEKILKWAKGITKEKKSTK